MKDVDIFASCLKDLLLENDVVAVPGLGSFMTRLMPASFADLGRTINPPYRKLSFRASSQGDTDIFVSHLATLLPADQDAGEWLAAFVAGFKEELDKTKRVALAALGEMRATAQNDYFFVASDDLDIYPEGMGLEPVTIKTSTLMEPEPEAQAKEENDEIFELASEDDMSPSDSGQQEPEPETENTAGPEAEAEPADAGDEEPALELAPETDPENEPEPEKEPATAPDKEPETVPVHEPDAESGRHRRMQWWVILLIVLAVLLVFLVLSVIFKDNLPWGTAVDNILNRLLYTEEELRIINS